MKFSINNLLSKYNLVLIIPILFIIIVIYIAFNANSYKEHMDNPFLKKIDFNDILEKLRQYETPQNETSAADNLPIISTNSFIPVCILLNENSCSKNNYCKWNSNKKICNKLNMCNLLDTNRCANSNNCIWNDSKNTCFYK
jgi:hypothetical protein